MKNDNVILKLRKEKGITQQQLGDALGITAKAVSKWENGAGLPDIALVTALADYFGVDSRVILDGSIAENSPDMGNMKKTKIMICPLCGGISAASEGMTVTCCGRVLEPADPVKTSEDDEHYIEAEIVEDEWFLTSNHEMTKEHHITFIAYLSGDRIEIVRQYPEWEMQTRIKKRGHGRLICGCSRHGLFSRTI